MGKGETDQQTNIVVVITEMLKQTKKWPQALAFGFFTLIIYAFATRSHLGEPGNLLWGFLLIFLVTMVANIVLTVIGRRQDKTAHSVSGATDLPMLRGNVRFSNSSPVRGAIVTVDGIDRRKETDETGFFAIEVNHQKSWTIRAQFAGKHTEKRVRQGTSMQNIQLIFEAEETQSPSRPSTPRQTGSNMDKRFLRDTLNQHFSLEDLESLCLNIQEALQQDEKKIQVDLETVGGNGKVGKILRLIEYLDNRQALKYLEDAIRLERPGVLDA